MNGPPKRFDDAAEDDGFLALDDASSLEHFLFPLLLSAPLTSGPVFDAAVTAYGNKAAFTAACPPHEDGLLIRFFELGRSLAKICQGGFEPQACCGCLASQAF